MLIESVCIHILLCFGIRQVEIEFCGCRYIHFEIGNPITNGKLYSLNNLEKEVIMDSCDKDCL